MGIYYSNAWNSRDLPFMSANLLNKDGTRYTVQKIFENGILNRKTLGLVGLPVMAGSYVWMQMSNNMAVRFLQSLTDSRSEACSLTSSSSGAQTSSRGSRVFAKRT